MPPPEENPAKIKQIWEAVSRLSEKLKHAPTKEGGNENLELRFLDGLSESPSEISSLGIQDLARRIGVQDQLHDLKSKIEIHGFRKSFLLFLFGLVCVWLLVVIALVGWNASSPSIDDRIKLLSAQVEFNKTQPQLSGLYFSQRKTIYPSFCPTLFHLSDSVLIAFITSTTVAVLGLFLTAARWLFNDQSKSKPETEAPKSSDSE